MSKCHYQCQYFVITYAFNYCLSTNKGQSVLQLLVMYVSAVLVKEIYSTDTTTLPGLFLYITYYV